MTVRRKSSNASDFPGRTNSLDGLRASQVNVGANESARALDAGASVQPADTRAPGPGAVGRAPEPERLDAATSAAKQVAHDRAAEYRRLSDRGINEQNAGAAISCDPGEEHNVGIVGSISIGPTDAPVAPGRWALASRLASIVVNCHAGLVGPNAPYAQRDIAHASVLLPVCDAAVAVGLIRQAVYHIGRALSSIVVDGWRGDELTHVLRTYTTTLDALHREHAACVATLTAICNGLEDGE